MTSGRGERISLTLPGGLLDGGRRHQLAEVRALTGWEEELLAETDGTTSVAERVTAVLARCVTRIGSVSLDPFSFRQLTVGDREALLIALRWSTLGDRIDCVLRCPADGCGQQIDVPLRAGDLLIEPYDDFRPWYEEAVGDAVVRFRLPTGGDQEQVADLARVDPARAAHQLLSRCVEIDDRHDLRDEQLADAVSARMAELDPQAELRLRLRCAWCQAEISTVLDMAGFLFTEGARSATRLYQEVHVLAWTYHWGEAEILGLPTPRRRRYLDLIADMAESASHLRTA
jgi:hypothetical protein